MNKHGYAISSGYSSKNTLCKLSTFSSSFLLLLLLLRLHIPLLLLLLLRLHLPLLLPLLLYIEWRNFCFLVWIEFYLLHTCPVGWWVGGWGPVGGGRVGGWVAIYLKSNHVPETLSFSKICSERLFSSCNFFLTDGPTDRPTDGPTNLLIEAPFPELKKLGFRL